MSNGNGQGESEVATKNESALARVTMGETGVRLTTLQDAKDMCHLAFQSGLLPDYYKNPAQVFVAVQRGAELGMKPMQAVYAFYVVHNTPALWGKAILGLIRSKGHKLTVGTDGGGESLRGWIRYERADTGEKGEVEFTMADAKTASLLKNNTYSAYPKDMLIWRAAARLGDRVFSDVTMGMPVAEIVRDSRPKITAQLTSLDGPPKPDPLLDGAATAPTMDGEVIDAELQPEEPHPAEDADSARKEQTRQAIINHEHRVRGVQPASSPEPTLPAEPIEQSADNDYLQF